MKPNKPRRNPDKLQNKYGSICEFYETNVDGGNWCHNHNLHYSGRVDICKGNRHNCVKQLYRKEASLTR